MKSNLLPCPFCGDVALYEPYLNTTACDYWEVRCGWCEASTADQHTIEEAINEWNTRAPISNNTIAAKILIDAQKKINDFINQLFKKILEESKESL